MCGEMIAPNVMGATQKSAQTRKILMERVAERYYARLTKPCMSVPERQWTLPAPAPEQSGPRSVGELQSKILTFDGQGVPVTKQDTVDGGGPQEQQYVNRFHAYFIDQ